MKLQGQFFFLLIYAVICSDYVALAVVKFEYGKFLNWHYQEKLKSSERKYLSATLSTLNPTYTDRG